jgi:hypothetical protein
VDAFVPVLELLAVEAALEVWLDVEVDWAWASGTVMPAATTANRKKFFIVFLHTC